MGCRGDTLQSCVWLITAGHLQERLTREMAAEAEARLAPLRMDRVPPPPPPGLSYFETRLWDAFCAADVDGSMSISKRELFITLEVTAVLLQRPAPAASCFCNSLLLQRPAAAAPPCCCCTTLLLHCPAAATPAAATLLLYHPADRPAAAPPCCSGPAADNLRCGVPPVALEGAQPQTK